MRTTTLARVGAAVLGASLVLTACSDGDSGEASDDSSEAGSPSESSSDTGDDGFADQDAKAIAQAGKDAMAALTSVRVAGSITDDGQEIGIDLATSTEGDCTGSISLGGASVELLGVDGQTWFKPDDAFWSSQAGAQGEAIARLVAGRWVVVPADDENFSQFCDLDSLLDELIDDDGEADDTYEKGEVTDVDGTETVPVTNTSQDSGPATAYIQVDGEHYLLKVERTGDGATGEINFSEFDEPVDAQAPAAEDAVDLEELGN